MRISLSIAAAASAVLAATPALADDISPWTPVPGGVEAEISISRQKADKLYVGKTVAPLPTELKQDAVSLSVVYGITERLAVDLQFSYAKSDFLTDPALAPRGGEKGLNDILIGARYKVLDEVDGAPLTATIGAQAIIAPGYKTGSLPAIGDGGSGGQFALALGKQIGPVSLSADAGYRIRSNKVPEEWFGAIRGSLTITNGVAVYGGLAFVDSQGTLDIGGPGFTPARFPEVQEDFKLWTVGASAAVTHTTSVNLTYGEKFDGRNTGKGNVIRLGVGYAF